MVEGQSGGCRRPFVRQFRRKGKPPAHEMVFGAERAAASSNFLSCAGAAARCGDPHGRGRRFDVFLLR
jgi:hypothetical protein